MATDGERVALVTGAGSGIGRASVSALLREGWRVAAVDREAKGLLELTDGVSAGDVLTAAVDVTDEAAVAAVVRRAVERFGRIDGVVNSAGIGADVPALETTAAQFRHILDVNVIGSFIVATAAARVMRDLGTGGAIVNIASISGLRGSKGRVAYGASKGAVVTMTQTLANDLADFAIRVNAIAPGPVETPMVSAMHTAADRNLFLRYIPLARYGRPEEIAEAVAFLLDGRKAGYITGEVLAVDGGFRGAGIIAGRS